MQHTEKEDKKNLSKEFIDLLTVFIFLKSNLKIIGSVTLIFSFITVIWTLLLPNIYHSTGILNPTTSEGNLESSASGLRGLAGIAGIDLSSGPKISNAQKAKEKIVSLSFFEKNILPNIFLPNLLALEAWDSKTNRLIYDKKVYDLSSNTWVEDAFKEGNDIPSSQKGFEKFRKHLILSENEDNGFITIKIRHQSPYIAKQWVELIVREINNYYSEKEKQEDEKAINFLNNELLKTRLSEIKQALAELLKIEIQKLTLIEANEAFVYDYIDPPAVMEKKSEPARSFICILGAIFGFLIGCFIAFISHTKSK